MSTQQDIYAAGSESRPPMLNKENYVSWSSHLLRYAKSRPKGKLIHNSMLNGPYIEADDQAIQTILLGLPEDIYAAVDSCETAQEIWLRTKDLHTYDYTQLYDFLKYNQKEVDEFKAERLTKTQDPLALMENFNPYAFLAPHQDQSSFNHNYLQQPMPNPEDITDPTTAMNMALALMAKAFKLNYSTPTNNNQRSSSNPRNRQIAQLGQNARNLTGYNDVIGNQVIQNAVQNLRVQNIGNQNGIIGVQGNGNQNQIGNGNLVAARAEGNAAGQNGNQIRCYNCRGVGHYARNCTIRPRRRDVAYLQTQLLIAQKEEAGIQLQAEEYDLMAAAADIDEIKEVNAKCILIANLQQASTSYTELLEPIPKSHQVLQNDNNVISKDTSVEQEKKKLKSDFKTRKDELLDKQIQLEKKIKELNNILLKTGQSIQMIHMLSPKPDSFYHTEQKMALGLSKSFLSQASSEETTSLYDGKVLLEKHDRPGVHDSEETLQLAQESREKMKQLNKEIKPANYTKINHLLGVFVSQTAMSREELYFSNISKTANVSKSISIPNDDFSDDTTPSVARKFLNEVKSTIVTLQRVVKHIMTIKTHNWSSSAHQELHKIVRDEIFPIVNQFDARVQNFEIQFLKEAAKFVGDFKSLANEADASLAKHKALKLEIECLLKAVVSQDIMNIMQKEFVVDTSDLQTELERTKERLKTVSLKRKMNMLNFGVIDIRNPFSQKLENENVELEFQVLNYARENSHLKDTYKNLFDSISMSRTQTKTIIASLQKELQSTIYKNAKLRTQLFKKVFDQRDNTHDASENTKFVKQPIVENLSKIGESHALSKPVTSNSVSTPQEPKVLKNNKVITPGMFRINPDKTSREEKNVPNTVRASNRTKPITISQPSVFTKKDVNSDLNGLSSTGSSQSKNKEAEVEEHHRNVLLSKNNKHMSSACNNIKLDSQDVISKVVCAMCKQCLNSVNHDDCLHNYVNDKNSHGKKQMAKVSVKEIQKKNKPKVTKPKNVGFPERLATPKPRKSRFLLRWSPTGRLFDQEGKLVASSKSESQSDCSNGDNACTSNTLEPKIKRFPNSTSLLNRLFRFVYGALNSCCSKHMTGNLKLLINFVWKFMGTVRFENDHVAAILGFGDLQWGNILITRIYFVEGLGHNLFSVGQFCDLDLEVAF
nr:integrase, catalytic region, zinc finger, CCHC-type, peptidase aspartic, catalytic [Tanacetum cinerariifolium]